MTVTAAAVTVTGGTREIDVMDRVVVEVVVNVVVEVIVVVIVVVEAGIVTVTIIVEKRIDVMVFV